MGVHLYSNLNSVLLFRQYILTQMSDTTSKQNLETIVEAIRHLEGDHLFSEESGPHQVGAQSVKASLGQSIG